MSDATKLDAARKALTWLVNLYHGVGRAGGEPESGEWEAAIENAVAEATADASPAVSIPSPPASPSGTSDEDELERVIKIIEDAHGPNRLSGYPFETIATINTVALRRLLASRRSAEPTAVKTDDGASAASSSLETLPTRDEAFGLVVSMVGAIQLNGSDGLLHAQERDARIKVRDLISDLYDRIEQSARREASAPSSSDVKKTDDGASRAVADAPEGKEDTMK